MRLEEYKFHFFDLFFRPIFRYHAVVLRERFDENKTIKDMRIARKLLSDGEEELFIKQHPQPFACMSHKINCHLNCINFFRF